MSKIFYDFSIIILTKIHEDRSSFITEDIDNTLFL